MEAELALYAEEAISGQIISGDEDETIVSIEDRIASFDGTAAKQTIVYVREGLKEIGEELNPFRICSGDDSTSSDDGKEDSIVADGQSPASKADAGISENTPLLV